MRKTKIIKVDEDIWKFVKAYAALRKINVPDAPEAIFKEFFKRKEALTNGTET